MYIIMYVLNVASARQKHDKVGHQTHYNVCDMWSLIFYNFPTYFDWFLFWNEHDMYNKANWYVQNIVFNIFIEIIYYKVYINTVRHT